jgi:hypothetical protein
MGKSKRNETIVASCPDGSEGETMTSCKAFHLDCTPILAECGSKCGRCLEEMKSVFGKIPGVAKFCREGPGVVVEYDADVVTMEQLLDVFRGLPSFYRSRFVPTVLENPGRQD